MVLRSLIVVLALSACGACSLLNPPKQRTPEQRECSDDGCEQDPCSGCDPLASCDAGRCRCPAGSRDVLGDGTRCETLSEGCGSHAECGDDAICVRTDGEGTCRCKDGYAQGPDGCENVDECSAGLDDCGEHERCVDNAGTFSCACPTGFTKISGVCLDDDECKAEPCGEHARCSNSVGAFRCECEPGYAGDPRDGCNDSNECMEGALQCSARARCEDRAGPDGCACLPYYSDVRADGSECRDDRVSWSLWLGGDVQARVSPGEPFAAAPGATAREELVAIAGPLYAETSLCGQTFTPGASLSAVVAVLTAATGECLWARAFPIADHRMPALAVDAEGAVVLGAWITSAQVVLDGRGIGGEGEPRGALLHFTPAGTLDWLQPAPCSAASDLGRFDDLALAVDLRGDVYSLLQYDGECSLESRVLPKVSGRAHGVVRFTRAGIALWTTVAQPQPGSSVYFFNLAVAPDGNVYAGGRFVGSVDLGLSPLAMGTKGLVYALGADGAPRWVQTYDATAVLTVAAGSGNQVHAVTYGEQDATVEGTAYELRGLDPRAGVERWRTPGVTNVTRWALSADFAGDAVFAGTVPDTAVLAGEALVTDPGGTRGFLLAYEPDGTLRWSHAFERAVTAISSAALTPRGTLIATGRCSAGCELGEGHRSESAGYFVLGMRP